MYIYTHLHTYIHIHFYIYENVCVKALWVKMRQKRFHKIEEDKNKQ